MLFNVEQDHGDRLKGYLVPDSGGTTPSVRVKVGGREVLTFEANEVLPHLIDAGRHSTGRCGFVIDETMLPGVTVATDLEITDAATDLLIYRRRPPAAMDQAVFRFETHLLPLWRLDDTLKGRFQFWYKGVERYGRETSTQVFCMNNGASSFISGRLLYKNFEYYLSKGVKTVGLIRDPYHELAERLVLLKNVGSRAQEILGERDALTFTPIIEELGETENLDEAFCKRFFRRTPPDILVLLSNPLVRQLTGGTPDEMPNNGSVASALDALASFDVLGVRSDAEAFSQGLADLLDIEPSSVPVLAEYPRVRELGDRLRENHDIEGLLEKDLEVFHLLATAFQSVDA